MPFTITLVQSADLSTINTIQWSALRGNPLIQTLYPRGPTPKLAEFTVSSYERASTYPAVRIIKATDDETGQIVAFAKWIIYRQDEQEYRLSDVVDNAAETLRGPKGWRKGRAKPPTPPDCYTRALEDWNRRIAAMRERIMSDRPHSCTSAPKHSLSCYFASYSKNLFVLDILHTHPSQQGKGAGAKLVKWGTDLADREGVHCYAETPVAGYILLRQSGFQNVAEMRIDLGLYKDGLMEYKHIVMVRQPFGTAQPERPPSIPPKSLDRHKPDLTDRRTTWGTVSEADEDAWPTLQYTAEVKMLDLRSHSLTRSPVLEPKVEMQASASMQDFRLSASTVSRSGSMTDIRNTSSMRDLGSSISAQPGSVKNARASMRDMGYSFSTRDLHAFESTKLA